MLLRHQTKKIRKRGVGGVVNLNVQIQHLLCIYLSVRLPSGLGLFEERRWKQPPEHNCRRGDVVFSFYHFRSDASTSYSPQRLPVKVLLVDAELQSAGVALSVLLSFQSTHSRAKQQSLFVEETVADPEKDSLGLRHWLRAGLNMICWNITAGIQHHWAVWAHQCLTSSEKAVWKSREWNLSSYNLYFKDEPKKHIEQQIEICDWKQSYSFTHWGKSRERLKALNLPSTQPEFW